MGVRVHGRTGGRAPIAPGSGAGLGSCGMAHISGEEQSTSDHERPARLSRRSLLSGTAGGVALVAAGQPAWATDTTRPGALRAPALATRDRQVVRAIRPARALSDLRVLSGDIGQPEDRISRGGLDRPGGTLGGRACQAARLHANAATT